MRINYTGTYRLLNNRKHYNNDNKRETHECIIRNTDNRAAYLQEKLCTLGNINLILHSIEPQTATWHKLVLVMGTMWLPQSQGAWPRYCFYRCYCGVPSSNKPALFTQGHYCTRLLGQVLRGPRRLRVKMGSTNSTQLSYYVGST